MELKNELVWSHSRAKLFQGCRRAYWYTYYGAWGGWKREAEEEVRAAYIQKKLTSRPQWIGHRVHGVAERALKMAREGQETTAERMVRAILAEARSDIEGSRSGAWTQRPARRTGFREHYYEVEVSEEEWAAAMSEIERQVHVLFAHRIFRRLLAVPGRIEEVEELRRFNLDGNEIYVSLDVLVGDGHGGVVIIDWKTGEAHGNADIAAQLGAYGLYASAILGVPEDRVKAMHVNTRHGTETLHQVGPQEMAATRAVIARDVQTMKAPLFDPDGNLSRKDDFPPDPVGSPSCRSCNFRRSCGREENLDST